MTDITKTHDAWDEIERILAGDAPSQKALAVPAVSEEPAREDEPLRDQAATDIEESAEDDLSLDDLGLMGDPETTDEADAEGEPEGDLESDAFEPDEAFLLHRECSEFDMTDLGNADRFVARFGDVCRFIPGQGWIAYDGQRWVRRAEHIAKSYAIRTARLIEVEAMCHSAVQPDDKRFKSPREAYMRFARSSQESRAINAILTLAQPMVISEESEFNAHPYLINTLSGVVSLTDGALFPHDPSYKMTGICPVHYDPENPAVCPVFNAFVEDVCRRRSGEVNVPRLGYLTAAMGSAMPAENRHHKIFFLTGDETDGKNNGGNGKSRLLGTIASVLGPDHYGQISKRAFCRVQGREPEEKDRLPLSGIRFGYCPEIKKDDIIDVFALKMITGEDRVLVKALYEDPYEIEITATIFCSGQAAGRMTEWDNGVERRVRKIILENRFYDNEKDNPGFGKLADPLLKEKLDAERDGIFAWLVRACVAYLRDGLPDFPESYELFEETKADADPVKLFVDDCLIVGQGGRIPAKDIYEAYLAYCAGNGMDPVSQRRFGDSLASKGIGVEKSGVRQRTNVMFNVVGSAYAEGDTVESARDFVVRNVLDPNVSRHGSTLSDAELNLFGPRPKEGKTYGRFVVESVGPRVAIEEEHPRITALKRAAPKS